MSPAVISQRFAVWRWNVGKRVAAIVSSLMANGLFFCGLTAIAVGAGMAWRPAGWIVGGLFAVWVSFLISAESAKR